MQDPLQEAIKSFPQKDRCSSADYAHGACDGLGHQFIKHADQFDLKGTLLAVDYPLKEPTIGWKFWGGPEAISHYLAWFPDLGLGVDFAARQFWQDADVPMVLTLDQIKSLWKKFPFGMNDSREAEGDLHDYA